MTAYEAFYVRVPFNLESTGPSHVRSLVRERALPLSLGLGTSRRIKRYIIYLQNFLGGG